MGEFPPFIGLRGKRRVANASDSRRSRCTDLFPSSLADEPRKKSGACESTGEGRGGKAPILNTVLRNAKWGGRTASEGKEGGGRKISLYHSSYDKRKRREERGNRIVTPIFLKDGKGARLKWERRLRKVIGEREIRPGFFLTFPVEEKRERGPLFQSQSGKKRGRHRPREVEGKGGEELFFLFGRRGKEKTREYALDNIPFRG